MIRSILNAPIKVGAAVERTAKELGQFGAITNGLWEITKRLSSDGAIAQYLARIARALEEPETTGSNVFTITGMALWQDSDGTSGGTTITRPKTDSDLPSTWSMSNCNCERIVQIHPARGFIYSNVSVGNKVLLTTTVSAFACRIPVGHILMLETTPYDTPTIPIEPIAMALRFDLSYPDHN